MPEPIVYRAKFIQSSGKARKLQSETGAHWVPNSITIYYSNDGAGNVKFSVEAWKEKEIEEQGFKYF
jgi:hypothetical protein